MTADPVPGSAWGHQESGGYSPDSPHKAAPSAHTSYSIGPRSRPEAKGEGQPVWRLISRGTSQAPPQTSPVCGIHKKRSGI